MTTRASRLGAIALLACALAACSAAPSTGEPVVVLPGAPDPPAALTASPTATGAQPAAPRIASIPWETSEETARARAKARKLPIVVFLFAAWDTAAVQMDRTVWADRRVLDRSRNFVPLRLDLTNTDANAQAVADRYDLHVVPEVVILDDTGREVARIEGFTTVDKILSALDRAPAGD
jgi:thiol:disulfide interchange protein